MASPRHVAYQIQMPILNSWDQAIRTRAASHLFPWFQIIFIYLFYPDPSFFFKKKTVQNITSFIVTCFINKKFFKSDLNLTMFAHVFSRCIPTVSGHCFFFLKRIQVAKSCLYSSTFLKLNFSQCFRRRRSDLDSRNLISMEELSVHLPWNLTSGFSVSKFCSSHLSPQMYVLEDV